MNQSFERIKIDLEEKLALCEAKLETLKRISLEKAERMNISLLEKVRDLEATEKAVINILEDTKELEDFLREEKNRIKAIINSMAEGLIVLDKNFKIILYNPVAQLILGLEKTDLAQTSFSSVIKIIKNNKVIDLFQWLENVFKKEETIYINIEDDFFCQTEYKKVPIEGIVTPLKGDGVLAAILVFKDASERKMLEEAKTNFISIASHQLRTPLTSIRWYTEMLLSNDAGKINQTQKEFLKEIYNSVLRLIDMINTLLIISRVEAGKIQVENTEVDIVELSNQIVKNFNPLLKEKNLELKIETSGQIPKIKIDQTLLGEIINNLISNAINYSDKNSLIEIKISKEGDKIVYSVKDNGIGIPKDQQSKIFQKFFRADNAKLKVPNGTGLGLNLVKQLVELWKGEIWFKSEEGKGTTFYFTLPLK